jgi:hypothetical protein
VNNPNPNLTPKLLKRLKHSIVNSLIPLNPEQPQHKPFKQHPKATNLFVFPRHSVTKQAMLLGDRDTIRS